MKQTKTVKRLLTALFAAAALSLAACGGGGDDSTPSVNVINPNDGFVTQAEAESIKLGMTPAQVAAILGQPRVNAFNTVYYVGEKFNGRPTFWVVTYDPNTNGARTIARFYADGDQDRISIWNL